MPAIDAEVPKMMSVEAAMFACFTLVGGTSGKLFKTLLVQISMGRGLSMCCCFLVEEESPRLLCNEGCDCK